MVIQYFVWEYLIFAVVTNRERSSMGKGVNMCKELEEFLAIEQNTYQMIWNMQEEGIELERICRICERTPEEVRRILDRK